MPGTPGGARPRHRRKNMKNNSTTVGFTPGSAKLSKTGGGRRPTNLGTIYLFNEKFPVLNPSSHGKDIHSATIFTSKGIFVEPPGGKGWLPLDSVFGLLRKMPGKGTGDIEYRSSTGQILSSLDGKHYQMGFIFAEPANLRVYFDAKLRCVMAIENDRVYAYVGNGRWIFVQDESISWKP